MVLFYLMIHTLSILCVAVLECTSTSRQNEVRRFPDRFLFGTATASYQVEGAWDEDGKSENIWDYLTHNDPCLIRDCSNGDIAANSYHLYERDVEMIRELGLDFYRFSISWSRLLPTSFPDKINEVGVQYYNNLINELLKYNIEPMVTLYHWDLPQKLQEMGGWTNPYIVDWFGDYARTVFELFGDRVKHWITINEPHVICYSGHGTGYLAPRLNVQGMSEYMCSKNLLLAHARAYHIYDLEYRQTFGGIIGITLDCENYEPATESDIEAASDLDKFTWQQYAHPIFSETGDYPQVLKNRIAAKSAAQGFPRSRLPEFSLDEVVYVRGTSDFYGLNHYSTNFVYRNESVIGYYNTPSFFDDAEVRTYQLDEWQIGESSQTKFVPWGFKNILTKIRNEYNNPIVYVTENGLPTHGGLQDDDRLRYYRGYLDAMLDAIEEGCNVRGYSAWSLMDNYEWTAGYTERFGLYQVDYEDPKRPRTPRKSAFVYKQIVRTRQLDPNYEPDTTLMTIDEGH